ncbi:MAG TPA: TonB family protein [Vicinamibacterales bacterium]
MLENVTDIIVARSREPEGLKTMIVWSIGAHIALATVAVFVGGPRVDAPRQVMTISLSGAPGPKTGGQTQIGGQAVQAPAAPQEPVKPVPPPPAPKEPAMSLPDPKVRPRQQPKPKQAPAEATAKNVSTGEVPREGTTKVDTRVRGQGFGLSSAGSNSPASSVTLDVSDFCCNEYIEQMVTMIRRSWDQNQGIVGSTTMKFTILRNGTIQSPQVERSSGFAALDNSSMRALQLTRLAPLPAAFENPTLTVHLRFDYTR